MRVRDALLLLAVLAVVAVAAYWILRGRPEGGECVVRVYTYESLLKWGADPNATLQAVYGGFEERYGCRVEVREFEDARSALLALIEEGESPRADVIIGVDNSLIEEAIEAGVLEPYEPPNLEDVPDWLVESLDPTLHAVPYDYGLIALVYDSERIPPERVEGLTFDELLDLANLTVAEDPTLSSTGLGFLMWQVAYYRAAGEEGAWVDWWRDAVSRGLLVAGSWGDAYDIFLDEAQGRPVVVSYGTDPAYSYYFYNETRYRAALIELNGEETAWLQVEGIGLVKGAPNPEAARKFIEWFLSPEVQSLIPLNNWMYPASSRVDLPDVFERFAIDPTEARLMNSELSPGEIGERLSEWLDSWRRAVGG